MAHCLAVLVPRNAVEGFVVSEVNEVVESADVDVDVSQSSDVGTSAPEAEVPGADFLGDPGKKALDAMKAKWKAAEAEAKRVASELAAVKAAQDGKEAEHAASLEAQRVKDEALAAANERILKAEVRAAAAGKFADPADALVYLDLSALEVGDDGEVDADAVASAVDQLLVRKPYLAAQGRRQGGADVGSRTDSLISQLTHEDVKKMSPEAIVKAKSEGRLNTLLGLK